MFQKNKAHQILPKTIILVGLVLVFQKIWRAWFSWNTRFEIRPFAYYLRVNLLPLTIYFLHQDCIIWHVLKPVLFDFNKKLCLFIYLFYGTSVLNFVFRPDVKCYYPACLTARIKMHRAAGQSSVQLLVKLMLQWKYNYLLFIDNKYCYCQLLVRCSSENLEQFLH